jgi:hypothetical protein
LWLSSALVSTRHHRFSPKKIRLDAALADRDRPVVLGSGLDMLAGPGAESSARMITGTVNPARRGRQRQ